MGQLVPMLYDVNKLPPNKVAQVAFIHLFWVLFMFFCGCRSVSGPACLPCVCVRVDDHADGDVNGAAGVDFDVDQAAGVDDAVDDVGINIITINNNNVSNSVINTSSLIVSNI